MADAQGHRKHHGLAVGAPAPARRAAAQIACIKRLTLSDASTSKQIKLPQRSAEKFIVPMADRATSTVEMMSEDGRTWTFGCTRYSCQYALSKIGPFAQAMQLKPDNYLIFYFDESNSLRVAVRESLPTSLDDGTIVDLPQPGAASSTSAGGLSHNSSGPLGPCLSQGAPQSRRAAGPAVYGKRPATSEAPKPNGSLRIKLTLPTASSSSLPPQGNQGSGLGGTPVSSMNVQQPFLGPAQPSLNPAPALVASAPMLRAPAALPSNLPLQQQQRHNQERKPQPKYQCTQSSEGNENIVPRSSNLPPASAPLSQLLLMHTHQQMQQQHKQQQQHKLPASTASPARSVLQQQQRHGSSSGLPLSLLDFSGPRASAMQHASAVTPTMKPRQLGLSNALMALSEPQAPAGRRLPMASPLLMAITPPVVKAEPFDSSDRPQAHHQQQMVLHSGTSPQRLPQQLGGPAVVGGSSAQQQQQERGLEHSESLDSEDAGVEAAEVLTMLASGGVPAARRSRGIGRPCQSDINDPDEGQQREPTLLLEAATCSLAGVARHAQMPPGSIGRSGYGLFTSSAGGGLGAGSLSGRQQRPRKAARSSDNDPSPLPSTELALVPAPGTASRHRSATRFSPQGPETEFGLDDGMMMEEAFYGAHHYLPPHHPLHHHQPQLYLHGASVPLDRRGFQRQQTHHKFQQQQHPYYPPYMMLGYAGTPHGPATQQQQAMQLRMQRFQHMQQQRNVPGEGAEVGAGAGGGADFERLDWRAHQMYLAQQMHTLLEMRRTAATQRASQEDGGLGTEEGRGSSVVAALMRGAPSPVHRQSQFQQQQQQQQHFAGTPLMTPRGGAGGGQLVVVTPGSQQQMQQRQRIQAAGPPMRQAPADFGPSPVMVLLQQLGRDLTDAILCCKNLTFADLRANVLLSRAVMEEKGIECIPGAAISMLLRDETGKIWDCALQTDVDSPAAPPPHSASVSALPGPSSDSATAAVRTPSETCRLWGLSTFLAEQEAVPGDLLRIGNGSKPHESDPASSEDPSTSAGARRIYTMRLLRHADVARVAAALGSKELSNP